MTRPNVRPRVPEHRFCDVLRKASESPMSGGSFCSKALCPCKSDAVLNKPTRLQQEAQSIRKRRQMTLRCLDCVKTDGKYKNASACRLSHASVCLYIDNDDDDGYNPKPTSPPIFFNFFFFFMAQIYEPLTCHIHPPKLDPTLALYK